MAKQNEMQRTTQLFKKYCDKMVNLGLLPEAEAIIAENGLSGVPTK